MQYKVHACGRYGVSTMVRNAPAARKEATFRSNFVFLGKFLRHGTKIASVWPSSKFLSRATISEVDFDKARVIVEMGAGTGPITDAVIERLKPHTRFLAIERDPDLLKAAAIRREDNALAIG